MCSMIATTDFFIIGNHTAADTTLMRENDETEARLNGANAGDPTETTERNRPIWQTRQQSNTTEATNGNDVQFVWLL